MNQDTSKQLSKVEKKKLEKRAKILAAAARVFADKGFAGARIADVALAAGIGKGTVYEYFASKDALFHAVFQQSMAEAQSLIGAELAKEGRSQSAQLKGVSRVVMRHIARSVELYGLTLEFWAASAASEQRDAIHETFREAYAGFRGIVEVILAKGRESGEFNKGLDTPAVAAGLVGAWDAFGLQAWFDPKMDIELLASGFINALLAGILAGDET